MGAAWLLHRLCPPSGPPCSAMPGGCSARRTARSPSAATPGTGEGTPGMERVEISRYDGRTAAEPGFRGTRSDVALQAAGQHPLLDVGEVVFALREVGFPGLLVPDLDPGAGADHDQLPRQTRVFPQVRRDGDPTLLVGHLVMCAG